MSWTDWHARRAAALCVVLFCSMGCNAILGTGEPILTSGAGGATTGGTGGQGPTGTGASGGTGGTTGTSTGTEPCGDDTWAHWDPADSTLFDLDPSGAYHDENTGLFWQSDVVAMNKLYGTASAECDALTLGSLQDFRLPTRIELLSLMNYEGKGPLSKSPFEASPTGDYWTASVPTPGSQLRWQLHTSDGTSTSASILAGDGIQSLARCVQGPVPANTPTSCRYDVGADVVRDKETGLEWRRTPTGMLNYAAAFAACSTLDPTGGAWEVPSLERLATLVDEHRTTGSLLISNVFFGETQPYWSTGNWMLTGKHFALDMSSGDIQPYDDVTTMLQVRCVRKAAK